MKDNELWLNDQIDGLKNSLEAALSRAEAAEAEVARLEAENSLMAAHQGIDNYQRLLDRIAELEQSIGLLTTLAPTMEMDSSNPMSMARTIEAVVLTRIAELEVEVARLREDRDLMAMEISRVETYNAVHWQLEAQTLSDTADRMEQERDKALAEVARMKGERQARVDLQSVMAYDLAQRTATEAALRWAWNNPAFAGPEIQYVTRGLAALLGEGE